MRRRLLRLFLIALAIRWAYVLAMLAIAGPDGLSFGDSYGYLELGAKFAKEIGAEHVDRGP
jgi:hypothetical protein